MRVITARGIELRDSLRKLGKTMTLSEASKKLGIHRQQAHQIAVKERIAFRSRRKPLVLLVCPICQSERQVPKYRARRRKSSKCELHKTTPLA